MFLEKKEFVFKVQKDSFSPSWNPALCKKKLENTYAENHSGPFPSGLLTSTVGLFLERLTALRRDVLPFVALLPRIEFPVDFL